MYRGPVISYQWRGDFASAEVEALHAGGSRRAPADHDWKAQVQRCEWLHVDFEDHLGLFYFGCCGFRPTKAGLIRLGEDPSPIR